MFRHIILKEILENLLSLRFVLSLVLVICLFAASGFVFVGKFAEQTDPCSRGSNDDGFSSC